MKKRAKRADMETAGTSAPGRQERRRAGWALTTAGLVWLVLAWGTGHGAAGLPGGCLLGLGAGTLLRSRRDRAGRPHTLRDKPRR